MKYQYDSVYSKLARAIHTIKDEAASMMGTKDEVFKALIEKYWPKAPKVKTVVKPESNAELRSLILEGKVNPSLIDVSAIDDFSHVFAGMQYEQWSGLKYWNLQYIKVDTTNGIHFSDFVNDVVGMFEGSNINDTARFGNWFSEWPLAIWYCYHSFDAKSTMISVFPNENHLRMIDVPNFYVDSSTTLWVSIIDRLRATSSLDCIAKASFGRMFKDCEHFSGVGTGLKNWCMSGGVSFTEMFCNCTKLKADLSQWGIGLGYTRPGEFGSMFHNCPEFKPKFDYWLIRWDSDFDRALDDDQMFELDAPLIWFIHDMDKVKGDRAINNLMTWYLN